MIDWGIVIKKLELEGVTKALAHQCVLRSFIEDE